MKNTLPSFLIIARLDRAILFAAVGKDARVEPGHDEVKNTLPSFFIIARLDRAILFAAARKDARVEPGHGEVKNTLPSFLIIARLDRAILFAAIGKDARVEPGHDEVRGERIETCGWAAREDNLQVSRSALSFRLRAAFSRSPAPGSRLRLRRC